MKVFAVTLISLVLLWTALPGSVLGYEAWTPPVPEMDITEFHGELQTLIERLDEAVTLAVQNRAGSPAFLDDLEDIVAAFQALALQAPIQFTERLLPLGPAVEIWSSRTNMTGLQSRIGETIYVVIRGSASGTVWGTDIYTADSHLGAAAVHAGMVRVDELGIVGVRMLPGEGRYNGSSRNGITTRDYGSYSLAYEFVSDGSDIPLFKDPGTLTAFTGLAGRTLAFEVTGSTTGAVWGTDLYTADSRLAVAAVHAGVLAPGQTGIVEVTIYPGQQRYNGSNQNGVRSNNWGSYHTSYRVTLPN